MGKINISVVLPIYNVEKYLSRALDSLINQTIKDVEIIIINDGSTDRSFDIAKEYANRDSRIKILNKPNGGVSSARNFGIKEAKGDYIIFLDSDDYYEPDMLETLYKIAKFNNCDVVVCGYFIEYVQENFIIDRVLYDIIADEKKEISRLICSLFDKGMFNVVWNKLYKTGLIKTLKVSFPEYATTGEDLFFNIEIFKNVQKIAMTKRQLYHYVKDERVTLVSKYHENLYEINVNLYKKVKELFDLYDISTYLGDEWLINFYFNRLNECLINLFRKDCNKTMKEKIEYITNKVLNDNYLKKDINKYKPTSLYGVIFKNCYKLNNSFLLYCIYSLLFFARNNMHELYKVIRKKIIKNYYLKNSFKSK